MNHFLDRLFALGVVVCDGHLETVEVRIGCSVNVDTPWPPSISTSEFPMPLLLMTTEPPKALLTLVKLLKSTPLTMRDMVKEGFQNNARREGFV